MAEPYGFEVRDQAEELYVERGLTYEQVAGRLSIALNTARNWGAQYGWAEKRIENAEGKRALKANLRKLRQSLVAKAVQNMDLNDVYAVIKLERLAKDMAKKPEEDKPDIDRPKLFLEDMQFVAETLKEIDPEGLKVLSRSFEEIVTRWKKANEKTAQNN